MFRHELTARYRECDGQGVAFNAWYLAWCDDAIDELLRSALGVLADTGWHFMVKRATLECHASVRAYEVVGIEVEVTRMGRTSFDVRFCGGVGGRKSFTVDVLYVGVAYGTTTPMSPPSAVEAVLRGAMGGEAVVAGVDL